MRVLLLGREGQIGWELNRSMVAQADVAAPNRAEGGDLANPQSLRALVRAHRPEVVINAAAYTAVDAAEKDEAGASVVNADAPAVLAEECARSGALLMHYSTDYVFDGTARAPYTEEQRPNPLSAYGRGKLLGEEAIRASNCRHLILRTSWIYAARGKNFLLTMLRLSKERDELRVVADQFGAPTWARAVAEGTLKAMAAVGSAPVRQTFHMTCGGVTSWHGFAARIVEEGAARGLCRKVPVRAITTAEFPTPARRPSYSVLSNAKLFAELGIRLPDWGQALAQCLSECPPAPP